MPPEDSTVEESYQRFYLKNIVPVYQGDRAHIPWRRFFRYLFGSGFDLPAAWEEFAEARRWVRRHAARFQSDAQTLMGLWDPPES
jgi:hypothetical protein